MYYWNLLFKTETVSQARGWKEVAYGALDDLQIFGHGDNQPGTRSSFIFLSPKKLLTSQPISKVHHPKFGNFF